MRNFLIAAIFIISSTGLSNAQDIYQLRQAMDFFHTHQLQTGEWKKNLTESDIEGSPFLNDEFINGTIFTTSKFQFVDIPLRYNIYNDNLEFKTPEGQTLAMAAPETIEKAEFGDYKMVYILYINVKKIRRGFFKVLAEGQASLYAKPAILYKEPEEAGAYKEAEPAKFISRPDVHYIRIGMEPAKLVSNKKELIAAFPDYQEEVAAFIKKNKTKPNRPERLIELVGYYNSLVQN
ncbi:MAG: hypothetical protein ABFS16_02485 [Bacteroidota bacterium]